MIDRNPVDGYSKAQAAAFFISFVLLGSLFGLNLFAGFMCDTFYSLQGTEQLEEVQWLGVKNLLKRNKPRRIRTPPGNIISSVCREILLSTWWQSFSAGCLLLNVAFMASAQARIINIQNDIFFVLLCVESFLNLVASGPMLYITTPSNQFDIFLIVATSLTMALGGLRSVSQAVRILRLSKFLRALSKNPTIAAVFETVACASCRILRTCAAVNVSVPPLPSATSTLSSPLPSASSAQASEWDFKRTSRIFKVLCIPVFK